jgi:hypothetical protein
MSIKVGGRFHDRQNHAFSYSIDGFVELMLNNKPVYVYAYSKQMFLDW